VLPLKDDIPTRSAPVVTVAVVAVNVLAYLYQFSLATAGVAGEQAAEQLALEFGLVPCRLTGLCATASGLPAPVLTIFTSMFLHGGLLHVGGNMLYLWIFGNNVEDTLGHARFLLFYLLSGVAAALMQTVVGPGSTVPMIGASGAVSGVLGAYLLLFPHANVLTVVIFGFFIRIVRISALIVLGFWIIVQFLNGVLSIGTAVQRDHAVGGGVAWFAHIGGFVAGMVLLFFLRPRPARRPW